MTFELIDITGNRWFCEAEDLRRIDWKIREGLVLEVIPYGRKEEYQYSQWYLCGDKVVSYRQRGS